MPYFADDGFYYSKPVTRTLSGVRTGSGNRVVKTTYRTSVNPSSVKEGVLRSSSATETVVEVRAGTGTGRGAVSYGTVGTYTYKNDGSTVFTPNENFNKMPEDVRSTIATDEGRAKQAINTTAASDGLTNELSTKGNAAPGAESGGGAPPSNNAPTNTQPSPNATPSAQGAQGGNGGSYAGGGGGYRYPATMKADQDHIVFTREEGPSVVLGIQAGIQDSNRVSWGESRVDAIKMQLAKASIGIQKSGAALEQAIQAEAGKLAKTTQDVLSSQGGKNFAAGFFAEKALGMGAGELTGRDAFGGQILNPNLELIFNGPMLRAFSFTFKMTPRDENETKQIKGIINFFKSNMVPRSENIFLKRPYYFDILYKGKGASSINQIKKKCALQGCSVQYTPDGSYTTYVDGSMTAYSMTLEFTETTPLTSEDYKSVSDSQITY